MSKKTEQKLKILSLGERLMGAPKFVGETDFHDNQETLTIYSFQKGLQTYTFIPVTDDGFVKILFIEILEKDFFSDTRDYDYVKNLRVLHTTNNDKKFRNFIGDKKIFLKKVVEIKK